MRITVDQLVNAIYGQESSHGAADTSKPNNRGAQGPVQVTQDTFKGLQRNGLVPTDWSLDNPAQAREAGNRHVRDLWNRYGGDVDSVLAAYYSGPKAVTKTGIQNFRDPVNKGAPDTLGYISEVRARIGMPAAPAAPGASQPRAPVPLAADSLGEVSKRPAAPLADDPLLERMPGKTFRAGSGKSGVPDLSYKMLGAPGEVSQVQEAAALGEVARTQADLEKGNTFYAATKAGAQTGLLGQTLRWAARQGEEFRPDPNFKVPALKGTQAEQEFLRDSVSQADFDRRSFDIQMQREYGAKLAAQGPGGALLAAFVGTLPENVIPGMGIGRAFALARVAGTSRAALGSGVTEGVVMAGAQASVDPYYTPQDALIDVGISSLLTTALVAPALKAEARAASAAARLKALQDAYLVQRANTEARVRDSMPGADEDEVARAVARAEQAQAETALADAVRVPDAEPALPEPLRVDAVQEKVPEAPADVTEAAPAADPVRAMQERWAAESPDAPQSTPRADLSPKSDASRTAPRFPGYSGPDRERVADLWGSADGPVDWLPAWAKALVDSGRLKVAQDIPGGRAGVYDPLNHRAVISAGGSKSSREYALLGIAGAHLLAPRHGEILGNLLDSVDSVWEAHMGKSGKYADVQERLSRLALLVEAYPRARLSMRVVDRLRQWWRDLTGAKELTHYGVVRALRAAVGSSPDSVRVFHGGPRMFDKFDTSFIGSGEGNTSQGWGLYFTEQPGIAEWYRKKEALSRGLVESAGAFYAVDVRVKPHQLLAWDSAPSAQHADILRGLGADISSTGEVAYKSLLGAYSPKQLSLLLADKGIAGTRYGSSRGGTFNYVVFDDSLVNILYKQADKGAPAASDVTPASSKYTEAKQGGEVDTGWEGWDDAKVWTKREQSFGPGGKREYLIAQELGTQRGAAKWTTLEELKALKPGVHLNDSLRSFGPAKGLAETLRKKFLGEDFRIILSDNVGTLRKEGADGAIIHVSENVAIINLDLSKPTDKVLKVLVHEIGHAVWQKYVAKLDPARRAAVDNAYRRFLQAKGPEQARMRYANTSSGSTVPSVDTGSKYEMSRNEFSAEQFLKYVEADVMGHQRLGLDKGVVDTLFAATAKMIAFFKDAAEKLKKPEAEYAKLFDDILSKQAKLQARAAESRTSQGTAARSLSAADTAHTQKVNSTNEILQDPDATRLGVDILPLDTPHQRAEAKAILDLYRRAEAADIQVDGRRLSKLLDTAMFGGGQSIANILLRSENPVARWFSATLLENPSGAAGRGRTAALAKALHEQAFLGNTVNELQDAYRAYRQAAGGSVWQDTFDGEVWQEFNRLVQREREARLDGSPVSSSPAVIQAADHLDAAYERLRKAQVDAKTLGWASLPDSSVGYTPRVLSADKLRAATPDQRRALHAALRDQFIGDLGFDFAFADNLASKYIDRGMRRAMGEASTPTPGSRVGAADVLEDALEAAGLTRQEIRDTMQRFLTEGPGHTKRRMKLDLNREYIGQDGPFRLGDLFETDQLALLRSQASRVSGEVALTEHGVFGRAGLDVIRRALGVGNVVPQRELVAFDQAAAEFLGAPYGSQSKIVDRVLQANALSRLGGMGFTQFSEYVNGIAHVGIGATMSAIGSIGRLRSEIKDLAKGKAVDNGLLSGMEKLYGAEFGTGSYKTVFPFDNTIGQHSWGEETLTFMDRLLRGGAHVQGKLSLWRAIHSAQQRGFAEQIVRKAAVMFQEKGNDKFLADMGIHAELADKMRMELPLIAKWDSSGRLTEFDVTKAADLDAAREFTQAVHRGVSQIIQGTFIGERGRWATDSTMRLLTQFRTFSLTAIEKQHNRSVGVVGPYKALGILLGAMCAVTPIYAARVLVNSLGREDADEYIDEQLSPLRLTRQTMNYVAGSGLAGDFLDALGALSGVDLGGRQGREKGFVGEVVAPAAGLLDDVYGAFQNTEEGTDPTAILKSMPFSKLPYFSVLVNYLSED